MDITGRLPRTKVMGTGGFSAKLLEFLVQGTFSEDFPLFKVCRLMRSSGLKTTERTYCVKSFDAP